MTIPTGEQQGVAGHITLGDYITVIASASLSIFAARRQASGGRPRWSARPSSPTSGSSASAPPPPRVQPASGGSHHGQRGAAEQRRHVQPDHELTQCDAEFFTWFLQQHQVRYTLESVNDYLPTCRRPPDAACPTFDRQRRESARAGRREVPLHEARNRSPLAVTDMGLLDRVKQNQTGAPRRDRASNGPAVATAPGDAGSLSTSVGSPESAGRLTRAPHVAAAAASPRSARRRRPSPRRRSRSTPS